METKYILKLNARLYIASKKQNKTKEEACYAGVV